METYKRYLILGAVIVLCLLCFIAYWAGRSTADRDAELERVSDVIQQLDYTTTELNNATRTNSEARGAVTDSVVINRRIEDSVSRSEDANARTSEAVTEAKRLIEDAKRTADEDASLIADSKRILDAARGRTQTRTVSREAK